MSALKSVPDPDDETRLGRMPPFKLARPEGLLDVGPFDDPNDFLRAFDPGLPVDYCDRDGDDKPTYSMILRTPEGGQRRVVLGTEDWLGAPGAWGRVRSRLVTATEGRAELILPKGGWAVVHRAIVADASRHYVSHDTEVDKTLGVLAAFAVGLDAPTYDLRNAEIKEELIAATRDPMSNVEWRVFFDHEGRLLFYGGALETHLRRESQNPESWDMRPRLRRAGFEAGWQVRLSKGNRKSRKLWRSEPGMKARIEDL